MKFYTEKRNKLPFAAKHAKSLTGYDLSADAYNEVLNYKGEYNRQSPRWFIRLGQLTYDAIDHPNETRYHYFEENGYEYQYSFLFNSETKQLITNYWLQLNVRTYSVKE